MAANRPNYDLYIQYVPTIIAAEARKTQLSLVYATIISLLSAALKLGGSHYDIVLVAIICVISLAWALNMLFFRALAQAKFSVIEQIESGWDTRPFHLEWLHLQSRHPMMRVPLSLVEVAIPITISLISIAYLGYQIFPF